MANNIVISTFNQIDGEMQPIRQTQQISFYLCICLIKYYSVMDIQQLLERQLIHTPKRIDNNFTYIIRKKHLPQQHLETLRVPTVPNIRVQVRSKSQNKSVSKDKIIKKQFGLQLYDTLPSSRIKPVRVRNIHTERATPNRKYKSLQKKKQSMTPQPSREIIKKKQNPYKNYLQYIRGPKDEQYNVSMSFEHLRRRGRRDGMTETEKKLMVNLINIFTLLYDNVNVCTVKSRRTISENCRHYLQNQDKAKIEIILSIYYPKLLHTKLRPYLVYQRQIIYYLYILNVSNLLQKLSLTQIDSIRLSLKYVKECLQLLFEPILEMEESVVSRINQTFKILKAIGQVQKKITIIQRQMRRMYIKSNKFLLNIQLAFSQLLADKEEWHLQRLCQKQMEVSWKFLQIPPVPYLPVKKGNKPYTLVLQLDRTIIYYDQNNKTLKYRPYIDIFLNKLRQFYEIVLFTMASQKYAEILVGQIEKVGRYFDYILTQTHLVIKEDNLVKDYSRLGRDIKKMVIIDHIKPVIKKFAANWIQILPWIGNKSDKSLYKLTKMLSQLANKGAEDVRHYFFQQNSSLQMIEQIEQVQFSKKDKEKTQMMLDQG